MAKTAPAKKPTSKKPSKKTAEKKTPTSRDPDLAKLPAALQKQAEKAEKLARERVLREARAAFDEARAAVEQTARGYYALGRALVTLSRAGYAEALGYEDFRALRRGARALALHRRQAHRGGREPHGRAVRGAASGEGRRAALARGSDARR